jgi:hypothetical protein
MFFILCACKVQAESFSVGDKFTLNISRVDNNEHYWGRVPVSFILNFESKKIAKFAQFKRIIYKYQLTPVTTHYIRRIKTGTFDYKSFPKNTWKWELLSKTILWRSTLRSPQRYRVQAFYIQESYLIRESKNEKYSLMKPPPQYLDNSDSIYTHHQQNDLFTAEINDKQVTPLEFIAAFSLCSNLLIHDKNGPTATLTLDIWDKSVQNPKCLNKSYQKLGKYVNKVASKWTIILKQGGAIA